MDAAELLEQIYTDRTVEDRDGTPIDVSHDSVSREVGRQIAALIEQKHLTRTLEIGMAWGVSTLHICGAHRARGQGSHVAIDPRQSTMYKSLGMLNVERAGLAAFATLHERPSHEALPRLLADGQRFDLVFIDGSHLFDFVLVDFFFADQLLNVGGYLVFDDLWMRAIRRAVGFVLSNRAYTLEPYPLGCATPQIRRLAKVAQRYLQTPFSGHRRVMWAQDNVCFLRKRVDDEREWFHYRRF